jgi:sterol 3beta-glucosyltransferase
VIVTVGSRGDVQPYIAVGLALQRLGHRVTLAVEDRLAPLVQQFGLSRSRLEGDFGGVMFEKGTHDVLARGRAAEIAALLARWAARWRREDVLRSYETALAGADVVVGSGMTMTASFSVAESIGAAWLPLLLTPGASATLRTREFPIVFAEPLTLWGLCSCLNGLTYDLVFRMVWSGERDSINAWRAASLKLQPIHHARGISDVIALNRVPVIVACSVLTCGPHGRRPGDWLDEVAMSGFAFVPSVEESGEAVDEKLVAFLTRAVADGVRAIYLGFGSCPPTAVGPASLVALAADVCARLRCRAVIVAGWSAVDTSAAAANEDLIVVPQAPHDWLFQRVHCIVHHCGIGTTAAALRSGTPQVPTPFYLDQPHNAGKIVSLGCAPAAIRYSATLSAATLSAAIAKAMDPAQPYVAAAKRLGEFVRAESAGACNRYAAVIESCRRGAAWNV